jgi:hypothetical protein
MRGRTMSSVSDDARVPTDIPMMRVSDGRTEVRLGVDVNKLDRDLSMTSGSITFVAYDAIVSDNVFFQNIRKSLEDTALNGLLLSNKAIRFRGIVIRRSAFFNDAELSHYGKGVKALVTISYIGGI